MKESLKNNKYKIFISIIFGFLGFFINFHTIIFPFGEYTAAILLGLLFPIIITLSWGWEFGLLSAIAGGCQTMWWLWGPSNGYAVFFVVPPFTLWVVWHGIFANLRRKSKTHKWWLSMYIVEIPFRILCSINLLILSRWAITLNPPSWSWASNASNTIPMHFSVFVAIKQAAVGFVVLLLADVILNISHVRKFLKLKEHINNKKTGYIISAFLLLGCLFWLLDSVFYAFIFQSNNSFIDLLVLDIPDYNIFTRIVFLIFCLVSGLITCRILRRQRESEIALRENKEELSQIIYGISIATFVINKEHVVTHWNKAAENLTGYTEKEMIGTKKHWKAFYSEERPVMADIIVNKLPDKEVKKYYPEKYRKSSLIEGVVETEYFFPDLGEEGKWIFFTAAPLKDNNGNIIGAIETLQDITYRKQAEEAIATLIRQQGELVKFGQVALSEHSLDALFGEAVALVSRTFGTRYSKILEHRTEDGILFLRAGVGWKEGWVGHKSVPDGTDSQGGYTLVRTKPVISEDIQHEKLFSPPSLLIEHNVVCGLTVAIPGENRPFGILGAHHDQPHPFSEDDAHFMEALANVLAAAIQRNLAEEVLKETNQSLEEMVYIASHDLQSPLISMEGFATDTLNNYRDKLDEQGVHQLERIKSNTQRMHTLVLSLLDISRLSTKTPPFITFNAGKVVKEVLSDLSLIIEKSGAKIKKGKLPKIFGDKNRIEGVFRKLITNAITYGGKNIEIGFKNETFFIKDDGIGIDKDQLENIFRPGERLKDIKTEGVGMGLTFCRKVINRHNGKLWAESDGAGKGAIFYFKVKRRK